MYTWKQEFKTCLSSTYVCAIIIRAYYKSVPPELIFNWDHMSINFVPRALWTLDKRKKKGIEIAGYQDKRQITGVMCGSLVGVLLPFQLVYAGKTSRCYPAY